MGVGWGWLAVPPSSSEHRSLHRQMELPSVWGSGTCTHSSNVLGPQWRPAHLQPVLSKPEGHRPGARGRGEPCAEALVLQGVSRRLPTAGS